MNEIKLTMGVLRDLLEKKLNATPLKISPPGLPQPGHFLCPQEGFSTPGIHLNHAGNEQRFG
jgi:hypothetical protein